MRGENNDAIAKSVLAHGTSPRARGKRRTARSSLGRLRNIPACAGKTGVRCSRSCTGMEHPRVRGENGQPHLSGKPHDGTSPRARGKHRSQSRFDVSVRNIPACAGKTIINQVSSDKATEHPRVRGENLFAKAWLHTHQGTSPRARGKLHDERFHPVDRGNIPACAGKTAHQVLCGFATEEHPRVRGENSGVFADLQKISGTSPRARGKRAKTESRAKAARNIPACAGKTSTANRVVILDKEHPRVRGENTLRLRTVHNRDGTSPRARGKHPQKHRKIQPQRNIPACAGKTVLFIVSVMKKPEHPRVRGENSRDDELDYSLRGTSPRARGKLWQG